MQNKILNLIQVFKGLFFIVCLFVCPLIFLTDTTQNPFAIQPLFLSIFGSAFILCHIAEIIFKKEINFRYSKLDLIFVIFLFSLLISLAVNYCLTDYKPALINDFLRKSDYLIFGSIFGFLFAKIATVKVNFEDSSYKFFKNIFLWCLAWFLWKIQASIFIAFLIFGCGIYLCFNHIKKYGLKEILDIMLAVCFCSCLYGIMQAFGFELFWGLDISKEFGARPVSTFGNPNFLASFALLFFPYSVLLFLYAKNKQDNLISGFIVLILALFIVISGTRSAWVGFAFCIILFFILSSEFRKIFLNKFIKIFALFLIFCVCTSILIFGLKTGRASAPRARILETKQVLNLKTFSLQNKNLIQPVHQRLMMWHCALDNFKKYPIFGKGLNSFQLNYPYCQGELISLNPTLDKMKMQANNAHNEYLEILSDGGLFSFLIYVFLWVSFFLLLNKKIKTLSKEEQCFYLTLVIGLSGVLVDNLFNITLRTLLVSFAFWFVFSAINNLYAKDKKINLNKGIFILPLILICVFIYALISLQTKYFIAQTYELSGYKNLVKGYQQNLIEDMQQTIKISSLKPEPYYVLLNNYIDVNDLEKAQDITEKALKLYPAYYEFNYRLSALKYSQNEQTEALKNLRNTLTLLPTYTPAAELFANILARQDYASKEDKQLLEKLINILPYEPNLSSYLAEIYFKENNCQKAVMFASKALKSNIFDKPSFNIINSCQANDGLNMQLVEKINQLKNKLKIKQDEALFKELTSLQKMYPDEYEITALIAEFYFKQGKFCQARDIMKQAKGSNFLGKSYNISLALSAQKCGDMATATKMIEEILHFDSYDEFAKSRLKNVNI